MTYYRLAVQEHETSKWIWKSTVLTSLVAVLHLLRIYSPIPPERVRVFMSPYEEALAMMLHRENDGLESGSRTANEFLRERRLSIREVLAGETVEKQLVRSTPVAVDSPKREERFAFQSAMTNNMDLLDQRRLHIELGSGGDHDTMYQFSLPVSTPQILAWANLMGKVQAGELQP